MGSKAITLILTDWGGTVDQVIKDGEPNANRLLKLKSVVDRIEKATNTDVKLILSTGGSAKSTIKKLEILNTLMKKAGKPNLFIEAVTQYCGEKVTVNGETTTYLSKPEEFKNKEGVLLDIIGQEGKGRIDTSITIYDKVDFQDRVSIEDFLRMVQKVTTSYEENKELFTYLETEEIGKSVLESKEYLFIEGKRFDFMVYNDYLGQQINIKSKQTTKQRGIEMYLEQNGQEVTKVIICGDELEDINIAKGNLGNRETHIIVPMQDNIPKEEIKRKEVIVGQGENIDGVLNGLERLADQFEKEVELGGLD